MNGQDRTEFDLIHSKIDTIDKNINSMKVDAAAQHEMLRQDIKFIKENLFDPHQGVWAESKLNTQFRKDTTKWRSVMGAGFIGLFFKHIYDMFT